MSTIIEQQPKSIWITKFIESLFAALAVVNLLTFLVTILPKDLVNEIFGAVMIVQIAAPLLFAVNFTIYWHKKERKNTINSGRLHAWFIGILRYWLAFSISVYGFAKIFQTQFAPSIIRDDMLVGGLNGFALTWNFFGHSYVLAVILGLTQIIGSILLVFRKTTLLAVVILLPVLINIVLINLFYDISFGAFINSLLYTFGLTFILLLRWADLKRVFLTYTNPLPNIGYQWLVYFAKAFCIIGAGLFIFYNVMKHESPTEFVGKWNVDLMIKNGDTIQTGKWLTDSTAWTTIYIENGENMYFCPNPYLFERRRSLFVDYKYVEKTSGFKVIYYNKDDKPTDTTNFKISNFKKDKMILKAIFHKDTLEMRLSKLKKLKK